MKKEQLIEEIESKLNTAIGMLLVPAMTSGDPVLKEAHQIVIDAANQFSELLNEHIL